MGDVEKTARMPDLVPERAGREGDTQPLPIVHSDAPDIQSMVIADIEARREVGIKRYGTALQAHNGRDALVDAYEEALDLATYLKQRIVEAGPRSDKATVAWLADYVSELEGCVRNLSPIWHKQIIDEAVKRANGTVDG